MKKLNMQTPDLTAGNIAKIAELFPNVITEKEGKDGMVEKAVDFDLLRQALQGELVEGDDERYRLDWPGKRASLLKANTPIQKTLRPDRESSVNFDTTQNLFIEGDNFEVLKLLQESYLGKVKMIYIDPPYNTGKDFVYKDNFTQDKEEYEEEIEAVDEEGNKMFRENAKTNPRFHSDWLSMMYERLTLARDLLKDEGVLFISIDDHEVSNLRRICNEIFGEENFVEQFIWKNGRTSASIFTREHEYIICFTKNTKMLQLIKYDGAVDSITERTIKKPGIKNPPSNISFKAGVEFRSGNKIFPDKFGDAEPVEVISGVFECKNGKLAHDVVLRAGWTVKDQILQWLEGVPTIDSKGQKITRFFFKENGVLQYEKERGFIHPKTVIEGIATKQGTNELTSLFDTILFDFPKPTHLIRLLISYFAQDSQDIVLDFFSGSATAAHALMALNAEDGGTRRFIMVQIPEETPKNSEARKAGYKTIVEIGKERIRRAGKKILGEKKEVLMKREVSLDIGFRVFKVDTTNMKDVYYHPSELKQESLLGHVDNVKDDRTPEDLLTQVILDLGLELSLPIEQKKIEDNTVYFVQGNALVACFDKAINFAIVDEIAKVEPLKVVFRDSSFKEEQDRTNVETRFKRLSPDTVITVL